MKSSNPTQSRGEEIQGGCCIFSLFSPEGKQKYLTKTKVDDKIFDFISLNTIFDFFCLDCIIIPWCHEVLENEKNGKVPIGSASIGQVHRATLAVSGLEVVVKVPSWDGCGPSEVAKMGAVSVSVSVR